MSGGTYHFYPKLMAESNRLGYTEGGAKYWSMLQARGASGIWVALPHVKETVMLIFRITRRQFYKVIGKWNGIFWDYNKGVAIGRPGKFRLKTPEELAETFDLKNPGDLVERPLEEILDGACMPSIYKALSEYHCEAASPITRKEKERLYGIKRRSQQNYHSKLDMPRQENFKVESAHASLHDCRKHFIDQEFKVGPHRIKKIHVYRKDGSVLTMWAVLKQLGSTCYETYHESEKSELTMLGKANGYGIWMEKQLCPKMHTHIRYTITSESTVPGEDELPGLTPLRPLDLASNYLIASQRHITHQDLVSSCT